MDNFKDILKDIEKRSAKEVEQKEIEQKKIEQQEIINEIALAVTKATPQLDQPTTQQPKEPKDFEEATPYNKEALSVVMEINRPLKYIKGKNLQIDLFEGKETYHYKQGKHLQFHTVKAGMTDDKTYPSGDILARSMMCIKKMALERRDNQVEYDVRHKAKMMGMKPTKRNIEAIDNADSTASSTIIIYDRGQVKFRGTVFVWLKIDEYRRLVTLNKMFWSKIVFEEGKALPPYINIPDRLMVSNDHYKRNLEVYLLTLLTNKAIRLQGKTILEKAGICKDNLGKRTGKRGQQKDKIYKIWQDLISEYRCKPTKIDYKSSKDWQDWMLFYKPPDKNKLPKYHTPQAELSGDEKAFVEKFVAWQSEYEFVEKSQDEIRKQISNTVRKYGLDMVKDIWEENRNSDHPGNFWDAFREVRERS